MCSPSLLTPLVLLFACSDKAPSASDPDDDGDGYPASVDCDDGDPDIHPGANEICNEVDDNCDAEVDAEDERLDPASGFTSYVDSDGDGAGDPATEVRSCTPPTSGVEQGGDCDDQDPAISPFATEICNDRVDDDCDGLADDEDPDADPAGFETFWLDADGDLYGDEEASTQACEAPRDYTTRAGDCDDQQAAVNPEEKEICDNGVDEDCSGDASDCRRSGTFTGSEVDFSIVGGSEQIKFGYSAALLDQDGDDQLDLLVGAPYTTGEGDNYVYGSVYLFIGPLTGGVTSSAEADGAWDQDTNNTSYAYGLVRAGDLDGDGCEEALVGAGYAPFGEISQAGGAALLYGCGEPGGEADSWFGGPEQTSYFGKGLAGLGDLDDDGFDDFGIGAAGVDSHATYGGSIFLWYGAATVLPSMAAADADTIIAGRTDWDYLGASNSFTASDLDGDGKGDLIIGSWPLNDSVGAVSILLGYSTRLSGTTDIEDLTSATVSGAVDNDRLGFSVHAGFDFDFDGYGDYAAYALSGDAQHGSLYFFPGGSPGPSGESTAPDLAPLIFEGTQDNGVTGENMVTGDFDGDGVEDLLLTEHGHLEGELITGAAYGFYGPLEPGHHTVAEADFALLGDSHREYIGSGAPQAGDVDGDGLADLIITAYGYDSYRGAIFGLLGKGW